MGRTICLDTDVLINIAKRDAKTLQQISTLSMNYATTTINVFEIWQGRKDAEQAHELFSALLILPFTDVAALIAGNIARLLRENGESLDLRDLFIATICITNDVELLTSNKKHFERLKKYGLRLA